MTFDMIKPEFAQLDGAQWIAPAEKAAHERVRIPVETVYFKRVFTLKETAACTLTVTAHSRYNLYVNGHRVMYGPCKGDSYRRYCDEADIGAYLKVGENTLIAEVVSYPPFEAGDEANKGPDWSMNRACGPCLLIAGYAVSGAERVRLTTGQSEWLYRTSNAMTPRYDNALSHWMGYMEQVDGALTLDGAQYTNADLGDGWAKPILLFARDQSMYGVIPPFELYKRPIPMPYLNDFRFKRQIRASGTDGFPSADADARAVIPAYTSASIELDAGELTTGFLDMGMEGGRGAKVRVLYAEAYTQKGGKWRLKGVRDDWENGELVGAYDDYLPSGGADNFRPFLFRTFRFLKLEVQTGAEPITLRMPVFTETGYPLPEVTHPAQGGANWINPLWDISLRTLRRCMHDTHEDCPYYEQMQYTMDTRLQILFTYAVNADRRMARRTLYDYHASMLPSGMLQSRYPCEITQVIPPFALHWLFMVHDYYVESGDAGVIERYRPTMEAVLGYFKRHTVDGLVEHLDYWEMIDWALEWDDNHGVPHACKHGPSTVINFIYAYTLALTAGMMRAIDLPDLAGRYEREADGIRALLHERCFNADMELYREGPAFEEYSQHAQIWAVLAGAGDAAFRRALMERVAARGDLIRCSFPLQFYMFRAYEAVGMYDKTEPLWHDLKKQLPLNLTTVPEIPDNARSDCHAWSSILLYEYPRLILGVKGGEPGWASVVIEPKAHYVKEAAGLVHTPAGDVEVSYTWEGGTFTLNVKHDCGVPVEAVLPDGTRKACGRGVSERFSATV